MGGSTLFPPENPWLDTEFFQQWKLFLEEEIQANRSIVAIIGGGEIARKRQQAARTVGITDKNIIDGIGIDVTRNNAKILRKLLNGLGIRARQYQWQDMKSSVVYLRGGTKSGHTTDLVAVEAAVRSHVTIVYNISNTPGLHPFKDGGFDRSKIISDISYAELLPHIPEYESGQKVPFDKPSLLLAQQNNLTVVLVGQDFENLKRAMCGEVFEGTIIHP